jgi:hypothetical protein
MAFCSTCFQYYDEDNDTQPCCPGCGESAGGTNLDALEYGSVNEALAYLIGPEEADDDDDEVPY